MAAMAAATAPGWRKGLKDAKLRARIGKLNTYLRETPPKNDHERLLLLWASTRVPGLLNQKRQQEIVNRIWKQQRRDGGWSIRTFATLETWGSPRHAKLLQNEPDHQNPPSDGYQTGLATVVLRDAGVPAIDPRIKKAVGWMISNQRKSGRWWTRSLNTKTRFHFITFSGTAYCALALAKCGALERLEARSSK